jgi:hypothetical protein
MRCLVVALSCLLAITALSPFTNAATTETQSNPSAEQDADDLVGPFSNVGLSAKSRLLPNATEIVVVIDREEFLTHVDMLKKLGILNPDMTQTFVNGHPLALSMYFSMLAMEQVIQNAYSRNGKLDGANFVSSAQYADDLGQDQTEIMYSFKFTRALYNKVNWDKFKAESLSKIAPQFHFDSGFMAKTNREM